MSLHQPPASFIRKSPPSTVARFTLDEYHRMIQSGVFKDGDPVELLDGWITTKMSRNPPHDFVMTRCQRLLSGLIQDALVVRQQCAITIGVSEPEPDICVAVGPDDRYADHHPGEGEIGVIIEVSDSTLEDDREIKGAIYAAARVPAYWIINIPERQVEVYSDPTGLTVNPAYRNRHDFRQNDHLPLLIFNSSFDALEVARLFPA
jgi:Uma2 family endonuclease